MRNRVIVVLFFLFTSVNLAQAQDYINGIGLRGGLPYGITFKHFISETDAFEGILSTRWGGFRITALYEIHRPTKQYQNLKWYLGIGSHLGYWDNRSPFVNDPDNQVILGIDGIIGMEYTFDEIPLNLGIDWIPSLNLIGDTSWGKLLIGVSARYVF
jgi:hypothetical protein